MKRQVKYRTAAECLSSNNTIIHNMIMCGEREDTVHYGVHLCGALLAFKYANVVVVGACNDACHKVPVKL